MHDADGFFDTRVVLYLLSADTAKADQAEAVLALGGGEANRLPAIARGAAARR